MGDVYDVTVYRANEGGQEDGSVSIGGASMVTMDDLAPLPLKRIADTPQL